MIAPLLIGFAFGWILQRSGLSRYEHIANIFRLRDATVLRFLLSALATGAVAIELLRRYDIAPVPVPATYAVGNFAGGVVFGVGMALSGFCPGTIAAGAGEGRLDYVFPGALGLVSGALVYGWLYPRMMPYLAADARETTFPTVLGVSAPLAVLVLVELVVLTLALVRWHGRSKPARRRSHERSQEGGSS